jgi:hypothetical protein
MTVDGAVREYIAGIAPEHRPLFDRLHRLILEVRPDATVVLSYQIPTYKAGRDRLYLGVWMTPAAAEGIPDDEFRDLVRAALVA